jgi:hypothetical protein
MSTTLNTVQRQMTIKHAVARRADQLSSKAEDLGAQAARSLKENRGRSQLTGLEALANSTIKTSDILDYIKVRIARASREWAFGEELLKLLQELREEKLVRLVTPTPEEEQQYHLMLMRELIRQMVAHYEYAKATQQ